MVNTGESNFFKSREFIYFVTALIVSVIVFGSFFYGGHTACKLGGGFYYRFACVDVRVINLTQPAPVQEYDMPFGYYTPLPDCACAVVKDNQVYCGLENLTN